MNSKTQKQLSDDLRLILTKHSGLTIAYHNDIPVKIHGKYTVKNNNMETIGDFDIEVPIPQKYPFSFPQLIETSSKIMPRGADRHIDSNGIACTEFTHKKILAERKGISLDYFFKNYVHKYFCWQLLFEIEGNEKLEEWPHNEKAVFIFYSELLDIKNIESIKKIIQTAIEGKKQFRNAACICGGEKKYKRCHIDAYNIVTSFTKSRLSEDIYLLNKITAA